MERLSALTTEYQLSDRARTFSKVIAAAAVASHRGIAFEAALAALDGMTPYMKAAVAAGTTGNMSALAGVGEARAWLSLLQKRTVLGRLTGTLSAPPFTTVPTPTNEPTPQWVADGAPAPLARMTFDAPRTSTSKYVMLQAFTTELFRAADERAVSLMEAVSLRALAHAEDSLLLSDTAAVATANPAGLLNGLTPVGGGSPLSADLTDLWTACRDGDPDRPAFVVSPRGAVYLAGLNSDGVQLFPNVGPLGGTIMGVPVIPSRAAGNYLILIDAAMLAVVDDGLLVEPSTNATVEMLDNPTTNAATGVATNLISAFQGNVAVVRFTRLVHWTKLLPDAVSYIDLSFTGSPS